MQHYFLIDQVNPNPHSSLQTSRYHNAGYKYWDVDNMLGHFSGFSYDNWVNVNKAYLLGDGYKFIFSFVHMPVTFTPALSGDALKLLHTDDNTFLVLMSTLEGIVTHDELQRALKKLQIPLRKVIVLHSNPEYHDYKKDNMTYLCINFWESYARWQLKMMPDTDIITPTERWKSVSSASKKFICLNRNIKPHRIYTMYALIKTGMIEEGHVSYHLPTINPKEYKDFTNDYLCLKNIPIAMHKDFKQSVAREMFPRKLDTLNKTHIINYTKSLKPFYKDSICSIVTESDHRMNFITEKTFKAIVNMHPFFIIGNPDQHTMLRARGYETFEDFFQTSAVQKYKDANYLLTALKQKDLQKLKNEYKKIYHEKCKHNFELFWKRKVLWQDIVNEIIRSAKEKQLG